MATLSIKIYVFIILTCIEPQLHILQKLLHKGRNVSDEEWWSLAKHVCVIWDTSL